MHDVRLWGRDLLGHSSNMFAAAYPAHKEHRATVGP
jgi:hypothetical protein